MPFAGIDAIESEFSRVRNWLVEICLHGVSGISPYLGHHQMSEAKADEGLAKGRKVLAWMEAQGRGPTARARLVLDNKRGELRRFVDHAAAVRHGAPQKMTVADYAKLDDWLRNPHR